MTNAEDTLSSEASVSAPQQAAPDVALNDAPATDTVTADRHPAAATAAEHPGGRHRHVLRGGRNIMSHNVSQDCRVRLLLVAESLIGIGCLALAYRLNTGDASPFAAPSNAVAWIAMIAGIVGIWLVPGLWLSAVMMRIGMGPAARLATRIGATLTWYALVGPVVHLVADDALVTRGGIVGVTVAATAAGCLGTVLGLVRRPTNAWLRFLTAGLLGGFCAQTVIWLSMALFSDGVNYEQIRRLDWLVVVSCGLLTAIGAQSRPDLPFVRRAGHIRTVVISLAVVAATAVALIGTGSIWSPAQRMPSAVGVEQVAAPSGSDVAFGLTPVGPDGPALIQRAVFTASDDTGRPVAVSTQLRQGSTDDPAEMLMSLDPESRPQLCQERTADAWEQGWPIKLTVRDQASGLVVQAVIPAGWCVP